MPPKRKSRRTLRANNVSKPAEDNKQEAVTCTGYSPSSTETDRWRQGRSLRQCQEYMLTNQIACDVFFALGPDADRYGGHRFVLLAASDVFYTMFLGPMAEKGEVIEMPDMDLDVFKIFLKYLYTEDLHANEDNVMRLMYMAKKYNIETMETAIIQYVESILGIFNVCLVMEQAHIFDVPVLHQMALEFIEDHACEVLLSHEVCDLCEQCLRKVLSSDNLHVSTNMNRVLSDKEKMSEAAEIEKSVLTALLTWTKRQCQKQNWKITGKRLRAVMAEMIGLVRFSQLDHEYFIKKVSKMNILTTEERCTVLENVVRYSKAEGKDKSCFVQLRGPHQNACKAMRCRDVSTQQMDNSRIHYLRFSVNENFYLHGFSLYRNFEGKNCSYEISAKVCQDAKKILKHTSKIEDTIDPGFFQHTKEGVKIHNFEESYDVYFRRKILLESDVKYDLLVALKGPPTFCGKDGRDVYRFYLPGRSLVITFHDAAGIPGEMNPSTLSCGQIPGLIVSFV